jgi:hypothetical protein
MGINLDKAILSYPQFKLITDIIMAYPEGVRHSRLNPSIADLADLGLIKQKGERWYPTESGVNHVMPRKFKKRKVA